MVLRIVCECGNDLTVSGTSLEASVQCLRCGRTIQVPHEGSDFEESHDTPSSHSAMNETGVFSSTPHRKASQTVVDRNSNDITVHGVGGNDVDGNGSSVPPDLEKRRNQDRASFDPLATRVDWPDSEKSPDDCGFDLAETDEETKVATAQPIKVPGSSQRDLAGNERRDEGSHATHGTRASEIDLSQRVMGTINRPSFSPTFSPNSENYGIHRILRTHQKGGMGRILIAYDQFLKRDVALKELHPEVAEDLSIVQRFIGEAEITAQLEHPGIVPIHSLGLDKNGNPYYTMKLIKGHTFQEAIKAYHRNPSRQELTNLVRRLVSVCKTMAFAHNKGVIHRDLKPANIMLSEHGETLVMDWGLAKPLNRSSDDETSYNALANQRRTEARPELTMVGAVVGTPAFMSPEQAMPEDHEVGPLSDIFSLGTILYYLLAGQTAFSGRTTQEVLSKVRAANPPKPSEIKKEVPPGLEAICAMAMARDQKNRYQNATEMFDDLCRWLDGEPVRAQKETLSQGVIRWVAKHRKFSISVPIGLILIAVLTAMGIHMDRKGMEKAKAETLQQIISESVDLTDYPQVPVHASPGITVSRESRENGRSLILCQAPIVPKSETGWIEIAAPDNLYWDLTQRTELTLSLLESGQGGAISRFFIRAGRGSAYLEFHPKASWWEQRKNGGWFTFSIPLTGSEIWEKTAYNEPDPSRVEWIEFHFEFKEPITFQMDNIVFNRSLDY